MSSIREYLVQIYCFIGVIIVSPLLILFYLTRKNRSVIILDIQRWCEIDRIRYNSDLIKLLYLLFMKNEFRNLFYHRLKTDNLFTEILARFFGNIYRGLPTLQIIVDNCDSGLYLSHGLCTIIRAKSIGKNCIISSQVIIGQNGWNYPTIGNNVRITSGAKVIGNVTIGDNSIIGANAVVVKNVPENCVVVGIPAHIIKRNGIRVNELL